MTDDLQYYPTPAWAMRELTKHLDLEGRRVLDPCAGTGSILSVARECGAEVRGYELDEMRAAMAAEAGLHVVCGDGLVLSAAEPANVVVLCNPPFKGESWWPWLEVCSTFYEAWLLLPNTVLNTEKHKRKLAGIGSPHHISDRVKFSAKAPRWGCAWWHVGYGDDPLLDQGWLL